MRILQRRWALGLLLGLILLALSVRNYGHYLFDDSYFGFSYAKNLANGLGFVFNPGERYLGTSAPFVVPIYAFLYKFLGLDIQVTAQLGSFLLLTGGTLALYALLSETGAVWGAFLGSLAFATSPLVTRIISHETLLYLGFGLLSLWLLRKERFAWAGILAGIAMLCRLEAVVLVFVSGLFLWFKERKGLLPYALATGLTVLPWVLFATAYFGSPLSNTVQAKRLQVLYGNAPYWKGVLLWLNLIYPTLWEKVGMALLALASLVAARRLGVWSLLIAGWVGLQCVIYLVLNVAFYHWFIAQAALLIALGTLAAWQMANEQKGLRRVLMTCWVTVALALVLWGQGTSILSNSTRVEDHAYYKLAHWVKANTKPTDRVAYLEIGMLKFFSGRFIVDWLGLTTPGVLPHMKQRDLAWVIQHYHPEIFIQNDLFNNYLNIEHSPWFLANYHLKSTVDGIGYPVPLKVYELSRQESPHQR